MPPIEPPPIAEGARAYPTGNGRESGVGLQVLPADRGGRMARLRLDIETLNSGKGYDKQRTERFAREYPARFVQN